MTRVATATGSRHEKTVYILRLEGGNYYVGATSDLNRRLEQHRRGNGAAWTKKHPVVELAASSDPVRNWWALEREVTLRMMRKYHWRNVRGAGWTERQLSSPPAALRADATEANQ